MASAPENKICFSYSMFTNLSDEEKLLIILCFALYVLKQVMDFLQSEVQKQQQNDQFERMMEAGIAVTCYEEYKKEKRAKKAAQSKNERAIMNDPKSPSGENTNLASCSATNGCEIYIEDSDQNHENHESTPLVTEPTEGHHGSRSMKSRPKVFAMKIKKHHKRQTVHFKPVKQYLVKSATY